MTVASVMAPSVTLTAAQRAVAGALKEDEHREGASEGERR